MALEHNHRTYQKGLCRCGICKEARLRYDAERKRLRQARVPVHPLRLDKMVHDTITREEYNKARG